MQEQKSMIYNVNTNERGNDELEERLGREIEISPIIVVNKGKIAEVTPTDIIDAVRNYSANKTVMEEATTVPTDNDILYDPTLWDYIKDMEPIDNKNGLNIKPYSGEGDDYIEPENESDDVPYDNISDQAIPSTQPIDSAPAEDEMRDQRLAAFFARILFFALLTKDKVKTLQQIIDAIKKSDDNKRIAQNVGLSFKKLCYIHNHINPFILSSLDYKINNINELLTDETYTPIERVERALRKFGRLSNSEVVTPSNVADDMVALLPKEKLGKNSKFLDIASKQGEFACALYKRFGDKIKDNIYALPTSSLTYEFTRKVFELLGIPVKNIFSDFNSYDLIGENKEKYIKILSEMNFDAIVGNPPYQINVGEKKENYGIQIFQEYVELAQKMTPEYISMVFPSKWFNGGRGLDIFRSNMLNDDRIKYIRDFLDAKEIFPAADIAGGINYILWVKEYHGLCHYGFTHKGETTFEDRKLNEYPMFIRRNSALNIIKKISKYGEESIKDYISSQTPFGFVTTYRGKSEKFRNALSLYSSGGITYVKYEDVKRNSHWIEKYKVVFSKATCEHAGTPDKSGRYRVFSTMNVLKPKEICTQSYLVGGVFDTFEKANNYLSYLKTRFVRFLMLQLISTQDISAEKFRFVPLQDFTKPWKDEELYAKYGLTDEEIQFIESMIKPME